MPLSRINARYVPFGFVWGLAVVAVYALARALIFGFDFYFIVVCGIIMSAALAAAYTHYQKPAPPDEAALRFAGISGRAWHTSFWAAILIGMIFDMLVSRPLAEDGWRWQAAFFILGGAFAWCITRLPFLVFMKLRSIEGGGMTALLFLGLIPLVSPGFLKYFVFLLALPLLLISALALAAVYVARYVRYRRYLHRKSKRKARREK